MKYIFIIPLLLITNSCSKVQNSTETEDLEEAVALGEYLNIPDQAYNYADPELPAFFNLNPLSQEGTLFFDSFLLIHI